MFKQTILGTPVIQAAAAVRLYKELADNMKRAGNALHNAVVDTAFTYDERYRDAVNQVPDSFAPATTHAEAITKMNALRPFLLAHFGDATYAHTLADSVNAALITAPDATGKGGAAKAQVLAEAIRRLDYQGHDHNEADALWLADMGARLHGYNRPALPGAHLKALDRLRPKASA